MVDRESLTQQVLERCRALGFVLAGVCDARPTDFPRELHVWLEERKHGEMEYLARNVDLREDPRRMVEGARSILCVADRYWAGTRAGARESSGVIGQRSAASGQSSASELEAVSDGSAPDPHGRIARYARGDDYHKAMKRRLQTLCDELRARYPGETFRACVDTAPVLEREHARRAGLGAVGKHTLLIQPGVGSYLLLGEILTTLDLAPTDPSPLGRGGSPAASDLPDPCGSCTRCLDACPTDAITPWSVDATKCISYLTIEHRSLIDPALHEGIGDWIFGCDVCQEVCPHNQPTRRTKRADIHPAYTPRRTGFDLLEVLSWTEEDRRAAFTKSPMKRAKLDMMKRNALIAAGNALRERRDATLLAKIESMATDPAEPDLVRETADQVLRRLGGD